jgi:PAS domain-containing protein
LFCNYSLVAQTEKLASPPTVESPAAHDPQGVTYVVAALAVALFVTLLALFRQRSLRQHLARQARKIAANEAILAEAQRIAHLGNWHYDPVAHTTECSPETLRILGRTTTQGAPSYFRLLTMMSRGERSLVHRSLLTALRDGIACEVTVPLHIATDNTKILHLTARPRKSATGSVNGLFGTVQDVTRQKVAEEGLRARDQLLRALYENAWLRKKARPSASFRPIPGPPGCSACTARRSPTACSPSCPCPRL